MKEELIHYGDRWGEHLFFLDHSCGEWVIGNLEEAKLFYKELGDLIAKVEGEKENNESSNM